MTDPNDICLNDVGPAFASRRDLYALFHISNIVRKNILFIAPGVDAKGFINFIRGPSLETKQAFIIAIGELPKTITKSVVASLGKYSVESRDSVGYSTKFVKIFLGNVNPQMAADFFTKNLTSACCNEKLVFLIQPYLVFRYDLKRRDLWFDKCRFIWISCALLRIPSLLPVVAAQLFIYSIKIFIQEPSLTRKEETSMLTDLFHFLPGIIQVVKPPFGTGLSVWYREMARHRRIVLEAILNEAQKGMDIRYYRPPYSIICFDSTNDLISFIEEELSICDRQLTIENEIKNKRIHKEKDAFGEDPEVDEEDRELLQLGGYVRGNNEAAEEYEFDMEDPIEEVEDIEEIEEIEEVEEIEEMVEEETMNGGNDVIVDEDDDDDEVHSESFIMFIQNRKDKEKEDSEETESVPASAQEIHIVTKSDEYDGESSEDFKNVYITDVLEEYLSPMESAEWKEVMEEYDYREELGDVYGIDNGKDEENNDVYGIDNGNDEENNDEAIDNIFDNCQMDDSSDCVGWEEKYWDPSDVLSTKDLISHGFYKAQKLLLSDASQMISSPMNLNVPTTPVREELNGAMKSCDGMSPSLAMMNGGGDEIGGDNTSARSEGAVGDKKIRHGKRAREKDPFKGYHRIPPPFIPAHIQRAPMKKMRMEEEDEGDDDEMEDGDEMWENNGGRGAMTKKENEKEEEEGEGIDEIIHETLETQPLN